MCHHCGYRESSYCQYLSQTQREQPISGRGPSKGLKIVVKKGDDHDERASP